MTLVGVIQLPVGKLYNAPIFYLSPNSRFYPPMQQTAKRKIVFQ
jgi:hypothetical protein